VFFFDFIPRDLSLVKQQQQHRALANVRQSMPAEPRRDIAIADRKPGRLDISPIGSVTGLIRIIDSISPADLAR
jgi:hypothetical protein